MYSDNVDWVFSYNADGMRTSRIENVNGTEYTYYYNGSLLRVMTVDGNKLYFVYDAAGTPIQLAYTPAGSTTTSYYYYVTNLQGDVIAIVNKDAKTVARYSYDAWGVPTITQDTSNCQIVTVNPFRYRGYYYDEETGLYYLQSRYYDPEMGRFINADAYATTGQGLVGNNMYAYCNNNSVNCEDPSGELGVAALCAIGAIAGGAIDYAGQVIRNYRNGKKGADRWLDVNWGSVAGSAFSGGVSVIPGGGAAAELVDIVGSKVIEHGVNALTTNTKFDIHAVGCDILEEALSSAVTSSFVPNMDVPKYIRDIKQEAREMGIKGTRKLQQYLDFKQITTILTNAFNASTHSIIVEEVF